jgi:hypothetical protein
MMEEVENTKKEALDVLRSVQTLEDLKEHDQEIVDVMVDFFTASVKKLQIHFEEILSMDGEKKGVEIEKFQNSANLADEEIDLELERVRLIPGSDEHMDPFMMEFGERVNPQIDKAERMMEKLMNNLGEGMMGSMSDGFGGMAEGMEEVFPGVTEEVPVREEPPVKISWGESFKSEDMKVNSMISRMSTLNVICSVEALESQKTFIPWSFEGIFSELLPELKEFQRSISEDGNTNEEFQERLDQIENIKLLTLEGLKTEMERISTIPGASEEAIRIKEECLNRADPHVTEIDRLLKDIRG